MKGDFTRFTYRRADHYSGVRLQQGRVQVDADWNEQVDLQLDRERAEIRDVVGPVGAPWAEPGFGFVPLPLEGPGGQDFALTPGRMYVDGILVEVGGEEATASNVQEGLLVLASGYLDGRAVQKDDWLEIRRAGSAVHRARVSGVTSVAQGKQIAFAPKMGKPAVVMGDFAPQDFTSGTVRRLATYLTQPDPATPLAPVALGKAYLAYLEVWERHVTAHEAPRLREVALGGPDTATRTQVAWRVRLEALPDAQAVCADFGPGWRPGGQSTGRLRARAQPAQDSATPCIVPQGAGYRRLENQLYRVEIHTPGNAGATYKWSRDNGHVVSRVRSVFSETSEVEVEPQGRDDVLDFAPGQVVELTEAGAALRGETGLLASVTGEADGTLTLAALPGAPALKLGATGVVPGWEVRRWEGTAAVQPGQWVDLEEGVQIRIEAGGVHRAGDWWAIPARTAGGDVEWPREGSEAAAVPPHGVARAYCPLSILIPQSVVGWTATDCRRIFPPLTSMVRMVYLGGDGQEVMPIAPATLRYPLQVGVMNGGLPVDGARVRFSVEEGAGQLKGEGSFGGGPVTVDTVAGVASCQWQLGLKDNDQQVRAELLQYGADADHPDILFNANLSEAKQVHFAAPEGCAGLAGSTTVQDALERLARTANLFYVGGDGQHTIPGQTLDSPLAVRLVSDCGPVQKAPVTFSATGGRLSTSMILDPKQGSPTLIVETDAEGRASVFWRPADGVTDPSVQRVTAILEKPLPKPWLKGGSTSVQFTAQLLRAEHVQYLPSAKCTTLKNVNTVQAALDELCTREGGRKGVGVRRVLQGNGKDLLLNDSNVVPSILGQGFSLECDAEPDGASLSNKPVCFVNLHLPFAPQGGVWLSTQQFALEGVLSVVGKRIVWTPTPAVKAWLTLPANNELPAYRYLVTVTVKGRFVWFKGEPRRYLGGQVFGAPATGPRTNLGLSAPEGGPEGSDFEMWFWLAGGTNTSQKPMGATFTPFVLQAAGDVRTGGAAASEGAGGATLRAADDAPGGTVALASLEMPATVRPGEQVQGTVRLSGPAPRGGFEVTLSSGDHGGVKEGVVVPAGKTEAPFRLDLGGARAGSRVTITATTEAGVLHKRVLIK